MSFAAIKEELPALDPDQRRDLIAYLVTLNEGVTDEFREMLGRKIDDHDPTHWMSLEEVEKQLGD
jgi:hypothetical protein